MRTALYKVITLNPDAVTIEMLLFVGGVTEEGQEKGGGRASEANQEVSTPKDLQPLAAQ